MPDPTQELLLVELHRIIASAAENAARKLGRAAALESNALAVAYPPEDGTGPTVTNGESQAIASLELSSDARSGVAKVIADACAATVFDLLCLMDGVAEPEVTEVEEWLGSSLRAPGENEEMLHDRFYESYWKYREQKATSGPS